MKNINYDEVQDEIETLKQALERLEGFMNNNESDAYYNAKKMALGAFHSRVSDWVLAIEEKDNRAAAAAKPEPRDPKYHKHCSISGIGPVNTVNFKNKEFGNVFHLWDESENTCMMLVAQDGKFKMIHTSCTLQSTQDCYRINDTLHLVNDQSQASVGDWQVIAHDKHTKAGIAYLGRVASKTSIVTATFK